MEKADPKEIAEEMFGKYGYVALTIQKEKIKILAEYVINSEYQNEILTELEKL